MRPAFHFAAIMLKYKLKTVDVKMKKTESEELSMVSAPLKKRRADTRINCARIDALHQIPEVGYEEHETHAYLMEQLRALRRTI